jgi:putative membrane protein
MLYKYLLVCLYTGIGTQSIALKAKDSPTGAVLVPRTRIEFRTKLLVIFAVWWTIWAFNPLFPSDWVTENILTVFFIPLLIVTRRWFRFSDLSYFLLFVFMLFHTVGAHFTYAEVPYEKWSGALGFSLNDLFGFQRNHFDRLVHFLFGLLFSYPVRELFMRVAQARGAWSYYLPVELVMSLSMLYELIEWGVSIVVGGDLGMAYLGTQGDIWDAHKDMALASLGAAIGMGIVAIVNWRMQRDFAREFAESIKVKDDTPLGEVRLREYRESRKESGDED